MARYQITLRNIEVGDTATTHKQWKEVSTTEYIEADSFYFDSGFVVFTKKVGEDPYPSESVYSAPANLVLTIRKVN